jgi:hypothetical protein
MPIPRSGCPKGTSRREILADLGHQSVEFNWQGYHYVRNESYFLMRTPSDTEFDEPEQQFERLWLTWEYALIKLTFEAEREWIRRAWRHWSSRLENIPDQYPQ